MSTPLQITAFNRHALALREWLLPRLSEGAALRVKSAEGAGEHWLLIAGYWEATEEGIKIPEQFSPLELLRSSGADEVEEESVFAAVNANRALPDSMIPTE